MLSVRYKGKNDIISLLNLAENQVPRFEAEIILSRLLNCNRVDLYLYNQEASSSIVENFEYLLKRRLQGEPLQYILGSVEFYGFEFKIEKGVFIPRPETELLVEEVLKWVKAQGSTLRLRSGLMVSDPSTSSGSSRAKSRDEVEPSRVKGIKILDIGTGCGNIAVSLAKMLPNVEVVAIDISEEAIRIAKENARINKVEERVKFIPGDIYEPLIAEDIRFDAIVSNPPYIPSCEIAGLEREILWEPRIALDGGADGLEFIRRIFYRTGEFLKECSCIFLELGYNQSESVAQILKQNDFVRLDIIKDYSGIERIVAGQRK